MKKNLILLASLICLLGLLYFVMVQKNKNTGTISMPDRDFKINDWSNVHWITIEHRKLPPMSFRNEGPDRWILNATYPVDMTVFRHVLKVMSDISMAYIPPKTATKTIHQSMKENGIQVKVFDKDKNVLKSYTIGSNTSDEEATFFLMDGYTQPYAMSLPVLKGGVRSRFEQPLQNYRDLRFFNFGKESVEKISLDYLKSQKHSFTIISNGSSYTLQSGLGQIGQENDINSKKIDNYLQGFIAKGIEHYLDSNEVNKVLLDRLPYCVFRTKLHQQSENTYLFYSYDDLFENLGNPRTPEDGKNINRFLVKLPSQEYVTIQNRNYKHLLVGYEDFLKH